MQKKKKSYHTIFEKIKILSEKLTTTTDNLALEKLRCHSAGGAKKLSGRLLRNQHFKKRSAAYRLAELKILHKNKTFSTVSAYSAGRAKKLSGRSWEINLLSERLMTTDDGQIGIRKAPLPFGWGS